MSPVKRNTLLWYFLRAPVYAYRWRLGWLLGHRFLLLCHTGRRTKHRHQTVLEIMEYRKAGPEAIVMSGFGANSNWLLNIEAIPDEEVLIATQRFHAVHRMLDTAEAVAVVKGYERRNRFAAPIVRGVLKRLLGWNYRGSDADRESLVQQLPLVAFRPRS